MTDKILCPWCGSEMWYPDSPWERLQPEMGGYMYTMQGKCRHCGAMTPAAYGRTPDEAVEKFFVAALRRYEPPVKPLTLEELINLTDDPVYIESQKREGLIGKFTAALTCHRIIWSDGTESNLDRYGKTWRCWPRKPTDEEREAYGWEDA